MSENNSNAATNKYLFINLVTMLGITVMQQLGKIMNPAMGKAEINLDAAQATIDTLDMLSAKTNGNLDQEEARLLKDTLSTLKMNFVETRDMEDRKAMQKAEVSLSAEASAKAEDQQDIKKADRQEESKQSGDDKTKTKEPPKFHKSYS